MWYAFRPYVPVAKRRAQAAREVEKRRKKGQSVSPVVIEGRTIARTFWGKAWCDNLESYSDYENRLPRGRSYVRNGSVVDLQIQPGKVTALVSGSELYEVNITITPLPDKQWRTLKSRCAGQIGSVVELLQGKLSTAVIGVVTAHDSGLFPRPGEIKMSCSCPDWAGMCKHIAAVLYGVGARLDHQPELFFRLRKVDHLELIEEAVSGAGKKTATRKKTLAEADVAGVFGIELAQPEADAAPPAAKAKRRQSAAAAAKPAGAPRRSPKAGGGAGKGH
ncbi:MAG TPA: SWIM zinc finger family protein [Gemmataceae bacterium]|nr:SWIM zinc finger family protein [Gemmataceae bacterium]